MRVAEIFGPTIQGEGIDIGQKAYFVRFAGCDSNCKWCDTAYAKQALGFPKMTVHDILSKLDIHKCGYVVLTGGNPCIYDLNDLVWGLNDAGFIVAVETQGTCFKPWLHNVDLVTVSPKGPSSESITSYERLGHFFSNLSTDSQLKVVIFNDEDLRYAAGLYTKFPSIPFVLQAGRVVGEAIEEYLSRFRWLVDQVKDSEFWDDVRVLPQLHSLTWGDRRGI